MAFGAIFRVLVLRRSNYHHLNVGAPVGKGLSKFVLLSSGSLCLNPNLVDAAKHRLGKGFGTHIRESVFGDPDRIAVTLPEFADDGGYALGMILPHLIVLGKFQTQGPGKNIK